MNCPFCNRDIIPNVNVILNRYKKVIRYGNPVVTVYISCSQCSRILAHSRVDLDKDTDVQLLREYRGKGKLEERYDRSSCSPPSL